MINYIKRHKWFLLTLAVIASISLLGLQFEVVPKNQSSTIGQGKVVLRIGTIEASGTVDYICDGTDDDVQFQGALSALPANGGKIEILAGNYDVGALVTRAIDNVTITGVGRGTYITFDGISAIFLAGGNNWTFRDLRTDAGGISMAATTGWSWENVTINATYYAYRTDDLTTGTSWNIPTGRTATYVIAASDAPANVKAQADVVCDGVADDVQIQAAWNNIGNGGIVTLTEGNFNYSTTILIDPADTPHAIRTFSGYGATLNYSGNSNAIEITEIYDSQVRIEGIHIIGTVVGNSGIKLTETNRNYIKDFVISSFSTGTGILIDVVDTCSEHNSFEHFLIEGCLYGIKTEQTVTPVSISSTNIQDGNIRLLTAGSYGLYFGQVHAEGSLISRLKISQQIDSTVGIFLDTTHTICFDALLIEDYAFPNNIGVQSGVDYDDQCVFYGYFINSDIVFDNTNAPITGRFSGYENTFAGETSGILMGWVTSGTQTKTLTAYGRQVIDGVLPANVVCEVSIRVTQLFNSDGTDEIRVGHDTGGDIISTLQDVSVTGVFSPVLNSAGIFNNTLRTGVDRIKAYYVNGGAEPTQGKALVIIRWWKVDNSP